MTYTMEIVVKFADATELEDPARFLAAYAAVSPRRREKVDRMRTAEAKRLSLCAGMLLADALRALDINAAEEEYSENEYGKPFLLRRTDVHFSLSHSAARAMCVVSDRPVGCDIQQIAPRNLRIARRFFSEDECREIFSKETEEERQALFFRIWALKESFIKCIGLGLALPLNAFSIIPDGDQFFLQQSYDDSHYRFLEPDAGPGYVSACCIRG